MRATLLVYKSSGPPNKTSPKLKFENHVVDFPAAQSNFLKMFNK